MKTLFAMLSTTALVVALAAPTFAKTETVKGQIIDGACYKMDKSNVGLDHKMPKGDTKDCALICAKAGHPMSLLTSDGKVYEITGGLAAEQQRQDHPAPVTHGRSDRRRHRERRQDDDCGRHVEDGEQVVLRAGPSGPVSPQLHFGRPLSVPHPAMSFTKYFEENAMTNPEQTAKRWVELFDKKDLRGLMTLYSENCVNAQPHLPQPIKGKKAIEEDLGGFLKAFPDARFVANQTVISGDTIAMEWTFTAVKRARWPVLPGRFSRAASVSRSKARSSSASTLRADRRRTGIFRSGQFPDTNWRDAAASSVALTVMIECRP